MKSIYGPGDQKTFRRRVTESDQAVFHGELLHAVYSTFALARDFEWASRLFFLEMKEDDEEGIGTYLAIQHKGPAFVGEEIIFTATIEKLEDMNLTCQIEAKVDQRMIATGTTGQKMLKKEKLKKLFRHEL